MGIPWPMAGYIATGRRYGGSMGNSTGINGVSTGWSIGTETGGCSGKGGIMMKPPTNVFWRVVILTILIGYLNCLSAQCVTFCIPVYGSLLWGVHPCLDGLQWCHAVCDVKSNVFLGSVITVLKDVQCSVFPMNAITIIWILSLEHLPWVDNNQTLLLLIGTYSSAALSNSSCLVFWKNGEIWSAVKLLHVFNRKVNQGIFWPENWLKWFSLQRTRMSILSYTCHSM